MQTAANTNRFLMGDSSSVGLAESETVVSHGKFLRHIVASHLAQAVQSHELFVQLADELIRLAERAYLVRNLNALEEMSRILMNLPVRAARQIGLYYQALAIKRKGDPEDAQTLLETVADNAQPAYRARAIQALGANHLDTGNPGEALRFQFEALRVASDKNAHGLQTILMAYGEISHVRSETGDHKGALAILESVSPVVHQLAQHTPFYFYVYHNELAIELGELGRIAEAEGASAIALASPFAPAYPEWADTRRELEAKRTSATPTIVAISREPEAKPSAQREPQRKSESRTKVAFDWPAGDRQSFQTSALPLPATARSALNTISVLDRVLICAGSRAPPLTF